MKEDRFFRNFLFQCVKRLLGCCCPYKGLLFLGERIKGQGYLGEPCNKGPIKVTKPVKGTDVLNTFRNRLVAHS